MQGCDDEEQIDAALEPALAELPEALAELSPLHGMLSVRLEVSAAGELSEARVLANTLIRLELPDDDDEAAETILSAVRGLSFPAAAEPTRITIPFLLR